MGQVDDLHPNIKQKAHFALVDRHTEMELIITKQTVGLLLVQFNRNSELIGMQKILNEH